MLRKDLKYPHWCTFELNHGKWRYEQKCATLFDEKLNAIFRFSALKTNFRINLLFVSQFGLGRLSSATRSPFLFTFPSLFLCFISKYLYFRIAFVVCVFRIEIRKNSRTANSSSISLNSIAFSFPLQWFSHQFLSGCFILWQFSGT